MISRRLVATLAFASLFGCSGRIAVGDLLGDPNHATETSPGFTPNSASTGAAETVVESEWEWLNPVHSAANLRAVGGAADDDLWLAGDRGSILHWNGASLATIAAGAATDSYWGVHASARDDVWFFGAAEVGSSEGARVAHWDGQKLRDDFSIAGDLVHAMWGAGTNDVWASVGAGMMQHWDGVRWSQTITSYGRVEPLRDVHGSSNTSAWAVGANGRMFRLNPGGPTAPGDPWFVVNASVTFAYWNLDGDNPFDEDNDYFAVFTRSEKDAWAAFARENAQHERVTRFAHWDGRSWLVLPEERLSDLFLSAPLPRTPLRRGRLFGETRGGELVFNPLEGAPLVRRNGTWERLERSATDRATSIFKPAGGSLHAVSSFGGFSKLDERPGDFSFVALASGGRHELTEIAPASEATWATSQSGALLRWTGNAWTGETFGKQARAVFALADDAAWAAYTEPRPNGYDPNFDQGGVATWDGKTWRTQPLPALRYATGVWASAANDVWVVGDGAPFNWTLGSVVAMHWDGATWSRAALPPETQSVYPDHTGGESARIWGRTRDDVWMTITGAATSARVLHWDGQSWTVVGRSEAIPSGRAWASGPLDLWLPSRPALRWDGASWSRLATPTDFRTRALFGTSSDRVFLGGEGRLGGAVRKWDGHTLTTMLETSAKIYDVRTSLRGETWAVGEGGTTLRLAPARPVARR